MSLINDALRRASKSAKERPPQAPVGPGMEPVPPGKGSRSNAILALLTLVVLLLAGWYFWQWWTLRKKAQNAAAANAKIVKTTTTNAVPTNAAPKPTGTITFVPEKKSASPVGPAATSTTATPVTTSDSTPTATTDSNPGAPVAPATVVTPTSTTAPSAPPVYVDERISLPVDLSVSAIMFNKTDPHALINGQLYGVGDVIQGGVSIKAIEKNRVIFQWNGHTKILMVGE